MSTLTPTRTTGAALAPAIRWVASRGVEVVVEPRRGRPVPAGAADHPTLVLVAVGEPAPQGWGELEDWIRLPSDPAEVYARAQRLIARAEAAGAAWTFVDDDDVLRAGARLVPLGPLEARLVRHLLERADTLVPRRELEAALWPDGAPTDPRALDNRLTRLRRRLQGIPVEILTVRGRGFLLQKVSVPADAALSPAS